jgi:hypothetical protein
VVEFDGAYWHRRKLAQDKHKTMVMQKAGWRVIRLRERPLEAITSDDLIVDQFTAHKDLANRVLRHLESVLNIRIKGLRRYLAQSELMRESDAKAFAENLRTEEKTGLYRSNFQFWTRDRIIAAFTAYWKRTGRGPSQQGRRDRRELPCGITVKKLFPSWESALVASGIEREWRRSNRVLTFEFLRERIVNGRMSTYAISKETGFHKNTIRKTAIKYGLVKPEKKFLAVPAKLP